MNVLILVVDDHVGRGVVLPKLHLEEINNTGRLTHLKTARLVVAHAVPRMLSTDRQALATVHVDDLAGNFVPMLRCQMDNGMAHFLDPPVPTHRVGVLFFLEHGIVFQFCQPSLPIQISIQE